MNIEIANRLVQLRKQHGFSQEELAAKLGLSRQAVSKWERAEASPDTDNLILLSRVYNVSIDELLRTEDPVPEPEPEKGVKLTVNGKPIRFNVKDGFYFTYGEDEEERASEADEPNNWQFSNDETGKSWSVQVGPDGEDKEKGFWNAFPYPIFIALAYLVMGIVWDLWHPAWILFITIPIYYSMAGWFHGKRRHIFWKAFPFPVFVVCLFLLLGCVWDLWYIAWVLFLTIPLYYPIVSWADRRYRRRHNIGRNENEIIINPDEDGD